MIAHHIKIASKILAELTSSVIFLVSRLARCCNLKLECSSNLEVGFKAEIMLAPAKRIEKCPSCRNDRKFDHLIGCEKFWHEVEHDEQVRRE